MSDDTDAFAFFYAKIDSLQDGQGSEGPVDLLESNQFPSHSLRESLSYKLISYENLLSEYISKLYGNFGFHHSQVGYFSFTCQVR